MSIPTVISLQLPSNNADVVAEQHDRLNLISEGGRMHVNTRREGGPETEVHFSPEDSLCLSIPVYGACCSKKSNCNIQIVCFILISTSWKDRKTFWKDRWTSRKDELAMGKTMDIGKDRRWYCAYNSYYCTTCNDDI